MIHNDLARLCVHTMTNRPWSLAECIENYGSLGIPAMSVWRNVIDPEEGGIGIDKAARLVRTSRLRVPALVRGGFFPAPVTEQRVKAIDLNRRCVDEAAALGADMVVLVVGAVPHMPLDEARRQVEDGIVQLLPHAESCRIRLAIEPLHPMYAADWSCINSLREARHLWESIQHELLGVVLDVYHVWFDPDLDQEIHLAGKAGKLFGFHICDWRVETRSLRSDRGLMGDGCIDLRGIREKVEAAGFTGFHEVEVFSEEYWNWDQRQYLELITRRYLEAS